MLAYPRELQIELTNACNFKATGGYCPLCVPMNTSSRPKGMMSERLFHALVDELRLHVPKFTFIGFGEPAIHPRVWEFLGHAERNDIRTAICTNGSTLLPENDGRVAAAAVTTLIICLDGFTEAVHMLYRRGSNFNQLIQSITRLAGLRRARMLKSRIVVQTIAFGHNEHQLQAIADWCGDLGVDHIIKKASYGHGRIPDQLALIQKYRPRDAKYFRLTDPLINDHDHPSYQLTIEQCPWERKAMVLFDGTVIKCCYDMDIQHVRMGRVSESASFSDIWHGDQHQALMRRIHSGMIQLCHHVPCGCVRRRTETPRPEPKPAATFQRPV